MSVFRASYADLITSRPVVTYNHVPSMAVNGNTKPTQSIHLDIDNGLFTNNQFNGQFVSRQDHRLYEFSDVPAFLRGNPFIKTGYRVYLSRRDCFKRLKI